MDSVMEIVSDNPNSEAERIKRDVAEALCVLSANLMRSARGAGSPQDIVHQAKRLVEVFEEHRTVLGHVLAPTEICAALSVTTRPDYSKKDEFLWTESENDMIEGALAIAADRQLHGASKTITGTRGLEQMHRGCDKREQIRRPR